MSRVGAEPFISAAFAFKSDEAIVARFQYRRAALNERRVDALMIEKILLGHYQWVDRAAGLFEAATRLLNQPFEGLGHAGERRGIDDGLRSNTAGDDHFGNINDMLGDAIRLNQAAASALDGKAKRFHDYVALYGVAIGPGLGNMHDRQVADRLTDWNAKQLPHAAVGGQLDVVEVVVLHDAKS